MELAMVYLVALASLWYGLGCDDITGTNVPLTIACPSDTVVALPFCANRNADGRQVTRCFLVTGDAVEGCGLNEPWGGPASTSSIDVDCQAVCP